MKEESLMSVPAWLLSPPFLHSRFAALARKEKGTNCQDVISLPVCEV